jgi:hypothetical protein
LGTEYNIKESSYKGRTEKMAEKIVFSSKQSRTIILLKPMFHLFLFFLPCLALAQYPKAMNLGKLYQEK